MNKHFNTVKCKKIRKRRRKETIILKKEIVKECYLEHRIKNYMIFMYEGCLVLEYYELSIHGHAI